MKRVQLIVCYLGLVLHLSIEQICQFELPPCDGSILGLDIADYGELVGLVITVIIF